MKIVLGTLLLLFVLLQMRLWTGAGSLAEINRLNTAIATQTGENAGLEARNQELMGEVNDLKNGLDSIEERARSELGLIRKGETFFLIVNEEPVQPEELEVAPVFEAPPEVLPELSMEAAQELPPEIDDSGEAPNPYLQMFSDGDPIRGADEIPPPEPLPEAPPQSQNFE